jgi:hypothetical protein
MDRIAASEAVADVARTFAIDRGSSEAVVEMSSCSTRK